MSGAGNLSPQVKGKEEPYFRDASVKLKEKHVSTESSPTNHLGNTLGRPSSASFSGEDDEHEVHITENDYGEDDEFAQDDEDDDTDQDDRGALVIYNPEANALVPQEPVLDRAQYFTSSLPERILPSVGAFTVQCANCFKWRLIPSKDKYEEIRESILQQPFICERAREWRPNISCDDPADINQDGSRLWAIDKPNIAQPPRGWDRILRIRGQGGTRFADVYYTAPTGKRLRSKVEIKKYLLEHPEELSSGVSIDQFSFQIPKPLQEDYVIKRTPNRQVFPMSRPLEPTEVNPLRCAGPVDQPHMQLGQPESSSRYTEDPVSDSTPPPAKRKATKSPFKRAAKSPFKHMDNNSGSTYNQPEVKAEKAEPQYINVDDL